MHCTAVIDVSNVPVGIAAVLFTVMLIQSWYRVGCCQHNLQVQVNTASCQRVDKFSSVQYHVQ